MTRYVPQWLQAGSYAALQDRRLLGALWPTAASSGCAVTPATAMTLNIAAGVVAVPTQNGTGTTLCYSDATEQVTLVTAPGANSRIDLVICRPRGTDLDGGANNDFVFDTVTGTVAGSPAVPATPAGTAVLAQILVGTGVATITAGNITDVRPGALAVPNFPVAPAGDTAWTTVPSFTNSWSAFSPAPAYIQLGRIVYLRGIMNAGTAASSAFTLPAGYRPAVNMAFPIWTNSGVLVNIVTVAAATGTVTPSQASGVWLSGISYPNF